MTLGHQESVGGGSGQEQSVWLNPAADRGTSETY